MTVGLQLSLPPTLRKRQGQSKLSFTVIIGLYECIVFSYRVMDTFLIQKIPLEEEGKK